METLNDKQKQALILLTSGQGLTYTKIAELVDVHRKTLYRWLHEPQFATFQTSLKELEDERWMSIVDVAKESALKLCAEGKSDMVKFVLQNAGYNPAQKIEADVQTDISITIDE
jgi:transposase